METSASFEARSAPSSYPTRTFTPQNHWALAPAGMFCAPLAEKLSPRAKPHGCHYSDFLAVVIAVFVSAILWIRARIA